MPPNFPEFAERMEASLSEVSEAGASNPSLQEKKESRSAVTESSGHLDQREPQSEAVTLEHVSKSIGISEGQDVKILTGDCQDLRFQQHSESSPHEFQPVESEAIAASANTDVVQEHRFSSATWPRAMKSSAKGGFSEKQHPLGEVACTVEMPPLSPCLSEEVLDPELNILVTPTLREKTESELKFEEDERWIMMEAEEEWEEEKLSERGKISLMAEENSLADTVEEKEQANPIAVVEDGADCIVAVLGTLDDLALDQVSCSDNPRPAQDPLATVPKDIPLDGSCVLTGEMQNRTAQELKGLVSDLECAVGPVDAEQLSDTDSVQMFLELEKECLCEEGVTPLVEQQSQASSEGLAPSQDAENSLVISHFPGAPLEKGQHVSLLNISIKDYDIGLDCEYFNALDSSQVPNAVELTAYPDIIRDTSSVSKEECEKVPFSPETAGEFESGNPADLESLAMLGLGELPNSDHRASHADLSGFIASELAKENGNMSLVDCSQTEGNAKTYVESSPLSCAFNDELTDVTSGPEAEVVLDNSHLLTDEMHLESEKGALNPESNSLTSLGNVDPCELSMEKVFDEAKELDCQAKLLEGGVPTHFHGDFPEQVLENLQRKSLEADIQSLHLLVKEPRQRDGVETVNDGKPEQSVASEGGATETRDSESLPSVFPEEQATKSTNTQSVLEERIAILQRLATVPTVPTPAENVPVAVVSAPQETAVAAAIVPFPEEDILVASVPAIVNVTLAAVSSPEGTVPAAAVPSTEEGTPKKPITPAASVPTPEEPAAPAAAVPTPEEPATPAAAVPTPEEPAAPAAAVPTPEEPAAPPASLAATVPTPEGPAAPAVAVPTPGGPASPVAAVPAKEDNFPPGIPFLGDTAHTESVPILEEGTPVLEWIKEDLNASAFGLKEVTGTVLHGKAPLATTDGLNSNEVIVAPFVAWKGPESKVRFSSSLTWC
uniref:Uncharacterized protein n=1 Tax=Oryctolagus cuniculus TaxID=9986 RepID=G1U5P6_RABIT